MRRTFILICLVLIARLVQGQVKPPLAAQEFDEGLNPVEEIRLFDLKEIKSRNIDTVYIIHHPASWAEYHPTFNPCTCSYNDTLSRYVFDTEGRIIESTSFRQLGHYSTTFHYDSLGNRTAITNYKRFGANAGYTTRKFDTKPDTSTFKQVFDRKKVGADSLIITITYLKFKHGLDTAIIEVNRYNSKDKLVEVQSSVNKRNAREFDDDTGSSTYHYQYDYDDKERLIYYRNYNSQEYKKIYYPFYGKLTEVYDASSNQLIDRQVKLIKQEKGIITITFDRKQITITPLENGSKLFKLITVVEPSEFPILFYHEIVYKTR
jgi:YD repeat-containing protein